MGVGSERLVINEEVVHCTSHELAGIVGGVKAITNGECVGNVALNIKCFLYQLDI